MNEDISLRAEKLFKLYGGANHAIITIKMTEKSSLKLTIIDKSCISFFVNHSIFFAHLARR